MEVTFDECGDGTEMKITITIGICRMIFTIEDVLNFTTNDFINFIRGHSDELTSAKSGDHSGIWRGDGCIWFGDHSCDKFGIEEGDKSTEILYFMAEALRTRNVEPVLEFVERNGSAHFITKFSHPSINKTFSLLGYGKEHVEAIRAMANGEIRKIDTPVTSAMANWAMKTDGEYFYLGESCGLVSFKQSECKKALHDFADYLERQ